MTPGEDKSHQVMKSNRSRLSDERRCWEVYGNYPILASISAIHSSSDVMTTTCVHAPSHTSCPPLLQGRGRMHVSCRDENGRRLRIDVSPALSR